MGIGAVNGMGTTSLVLQSPEELGEQLGGDVDAQVAAMVLVNARDSRRSADSERTVEEAYIEKQEDAQVSDMRASAEHMREAGTIEGIAEIGAGVFGMMGAASECSETKSALEAAGRIFQGEAKMASSQEAFLGKNADADATAAKNNVDAGTRRIQDIKEVRDDARDLERTAFDFLRNVNQSKAAADQASVSIRA